MGEREGGREGENTKFTKKVIGRWSLCCFDPHTHHDNNNNNNKKMKMKMEMKKKEYVDHTYGIKTRR